MQLQKKIFFTALLCTGLFLSLYCFYDNTDRETRSLRTNNVEMFMEATSGLEAIEDYHFDSQEDFPVEDEDDRIFSNEFAVNECLADPEATRTSKDRLESFVKGKCAPVIVLPGIMATKLIAQIDCEVLADKHPEIMQACGWNTCKWSLFSKRPASEYKIWIPSLTSPMNIIRIANNTCFGRLVSLNYDSTKSDISERYQKLEGVSITWEGNTPDTARYADGGFKAISNILPAPIQAASTRQFNKIGFYFDYLGYEKGLSLFAIPYDFRLTHLANSVAYTLERTIKYAYELTGKKVIIIGHSLGNLNALNVLTKMSQKDKDRMVANYVSVGAPFGGATKVARMLFGGAKEMLFMDFVGVQFFNQKKMLAASSSTFDLLPKDTFFRFKNERWMKELVARINLEKTYPPDTEEGAKFWLTADKEKLPLSLFPVPTAACVEQPGRKRPKECLTLLTDLSIEPVAVIDNKKYYAKQSSIEDLIREHYTLHSVEKALSMYRDSLAAGIHEFKNPKVPVVVVYGSHLHTERSIHWDESPSKLTVHDAIADPSNTFHSHGDGSVEVSDSLPIALKWAYEHLDGVKDAKPVKVAEYCSEYNLKESAWDSVDSNGVKKMDKTEYIGVPCYCQERTTNGEVCNHASMLDDIDLVMFLSRTAITHQVSDLKNNKGVWRLTNEQLLVLQSELPHLKKPSHDQDVQSWFENFNF
eukprot:CAMPEP_0176425134 /NCGR_PEP_ID=MMETSP0127-20121128/11226_1 /TAXON_ID=938130 /ORGANISM="Platyophrya macrostoma, Strain WH" /LENGTH=700 /DNA_ID=CAMNT_0017806273 /DNA_START=20 /DNA_END=2122 /DNA_ORIENTATION=+